MFSTPRNSTVMPPTVRSSQSVTRAQTCASRITARRETRVGRPPTAMIVVAT